MNKVKMPIMGQKLEKNDNLEVEFRVLGKSDIEKIHLIRDAAAKEFDGEIYSPSSDETIEEYIEKTGTLIGAWLKDDLIAFAILEYAVASEYAIALGWPEELTNEVASLQDCVVLKKYRGNELQQILCQNLIMMAEEMGKQYVMASVSPNNSASLKNIIDIGFITQGKHQLHGGKERFIVKKGLGENTPKRAFVLIDYTNDFVADDGKLTAGKSGQAIQNAISEKVTKYVQRGDMVFVLNDIHDFEGEDYASVESWLFPPHNIEGSKGRELYGKVKKSVERAKMFSNEHVFEGSKTKYSAFYETELEEELTKREITQVELCGVCSDICVLHTAVDAYNIGYDIIIDENCVASFDQAGHEFAMRHFENSIGATIIKKLGKNIK